MRNREKGKEFLLGMALRENIQNLKSRTLARIARTGISRQNFLVNQAPKVVSYSS